MIKSVKKLNDIIRGHHAGYEITTNDNVKISVPLDEDNTDYQNILKWVEDGNTIQESD